MLKPIRGIGPTEALADVHKQFIKPYRQAHVKTSASELVGTAELAWYRGHHAGIHDAYLTLRKKYPAAAKALIEAFGMNEDGDIGLG